MVFLAPKCQAKVHETTRKLKSKDYAAIFFYLDLETQFVFFFQHKVQLHKRD